MFSVSKVLKFHRDNYDPNRNKEEPPIYLPYLKPRTVCINFNPTRVSQTIQRATNDIPSIDSNQFIFYGLGDCWNNMKKIICGKEDKEDNGEESVQKGQILVKEEKFK